MQASKSPQSRTVNVKARLSLRKQTARLEIQADAELSKQLVKKEERLLMLFEISSRLNDGGKALK